MRFALIDDLEKKCEGACVFLGTAAPELCEQARESQPIKLDEDKESVDKKPQARIDDS